MLCNIFTRSELKHVHDIIEKLLFKICVNIHLHIHVCSWYKWLVVLLCKHQTMIIKNKKKG